MKTGWKKDRAGQYYRIDGGVRFDVEYDPDTKLWYCRRNGKAAFEAASTLREAKTYCVEPEPGPTMSKIMTLNEFANSCDFPVLLWAGVGCPGGEEVPLNHPDIELPSGFDELDQESPWTSLEGTVDPNENVWRWDGDGNPTDFRGNTVYRLEAYPDRKVWEDLVATYEEDVR
jgi:hypothetical protein